MKSIITRTRSALDQIGTSLSYPANIVLFPPFLQTTNLRPMCRLPNVPIAKCATTYTCPSSGESIVLVPNQVLRFGNELHCSLINPHQIRSHGFSIRAPQVGNQSFLSPIKSCGLATNCTVLSSIHTRFIHTDSVFVMTLGIDLERIFIPLLASGPNLFFESRVPTDWEMDSLPILEITGPVWNPADLQMSRPPSLLARVANCISTAPRDVWSELAMHLSAISPSFDYRYVSALYASQVLVNLVPTGTKGKAIGATLTSEQIPCSRKSYCYKGTLALKCSPTEISSGQFTR